jgi:hypothetical protein
MVPAHIAGEMSDPDLPGIALVLALSRSEPCCLAVAAGRCCDVRVAVIRFAGGTA